MKQTALTSIDSYKLSHLWMWPEGMSLDYANLTPRSNYHFNVPEQYKKDQLMVWFGIQGFLRELVDLWDTTFFKLPKDEVIAEFAKLVAPFGGDKGLAIKKLEELHDYGRLPLLIRALPEATLVPMGVPVMTTENADPRFFWLAPFLETWLSCELWQGCTSASTARVYRKILEKYAGLTGGSMDFVAVQGHDFSVRGMAGYAAAAKSGAGHLLSFIGTDNIPAVKYIYDYYRGAETFVGCSVPASEHGVMAAGTKDNELETYRRMLKMYPTGVVSLVSDTYDFFNVITNFAVQLKDEIMSRQPDSIGLNKTVFRPDSGDPVKIVAGYIIDTMDTVWAGSECVEVDGKYYAVEETNENRIGVKLGRELSKHEVDGAVQCLWDIFGGTTNDKGFRTLDQHVGLIYGDSITPERAEEILRRLMAKGFASDNIVFGIGSFTYQYVTRDTFSIAMKSTYTENVDGTTTEIFKDPVTDSGTKKSAKGCMRVDKVNGRYVLVDQVPYSQTFLGELKPVLVDGVIMINESFADLRLRLIESEKENAQ